MCYEAGAQTFPLEDIGMPISSARTSKPNSSYKRIAALLCKHTCFSSTHFLRLPGFRPSAGTLLASGCSGIHETVTLLFILPALRYFPCFIQCSEQKKIQQFIAVGLRDKLWPIIQADHGWVATTYSYPLQNSDYALS